MSTTTQKIPAAIVAGFLGAGKTTLLNHILNGDHGRRIAVLVNDFGEINIDSELITRVEGETVSLANGCVCCTIRGDLAEAVLKMAGAAPRPDYIVVETSGVSEPGAAAMGLVMSAELAAQVQLDAIITVVDSEHVLGLEGDHATLAGEQVAAADFVIANKADLADGGTLERVHQWIRENAPEARIADASHCRVPLELLFGLERRVPAPALSAHDHAGHDHGGHTRAFETWSWTSGEPLAFEPVYTLLRSLPLSIFRAKGILNLAAVPERRVILQMVGRRVQLAKGEPWREETPATRIVMIGAPGLQGADVRPRLEACLARNAPEGDNPMAQAVVQILRRP